MSRKILVPIDINYPQKKINDILYPKPTEKGFELTGIKTNKKWEYGMVILTSEVNANELFKQIVDSGIKINSVENLIVTLKQYIEQVPTYKIGNILEINISAEHLRFLLKYPRLTRTK